MTSIHHLTIATRGSRLALWQAEFVKSALVQRYPGLQVDFRIIKTKGDIILDVPLSKVGGKGLFVKEIEEALLSGEADIAVHSMKDVPMLLPEGLMLGVMPPREDPADLFLSHTHESLDALPKGGRVGTSSLRRQAQVLHLRPDLVVSTLRGNVDTRLRKLKEGQFDAIIMAAAGMKRLGIELPFEQRLEQPLFIPAVGQGALGVEYRADRPDLHDLLAFLEDADTRVCVEAERGFLAGLEGGCQVPIGGHAVMLNHNTFTLEGIVASVDGKQVIRHTITGVRQSARQTGLTLANIIFEAGGNTILKDVYNA